MKPIVRLFLLSLVLISIYFLVKFALVQKSNLSQSTTPSPTPLSVFNPHPLGLVEHEENFLPLTVDQISYRIKWEIINPAKVSIGLNLHLANTSGSLQQLHQCAFLTSGGFYGKNDKPIGLLIDRGQELSPWQENRLFNGLIGWNASRTVLEVTQPTQLQTFSYTWALQAGPVVWKDGKPVELHLNRDQTARRLIAAITPDQQLILIVITTGDSLFEGPLLTDVPKIITAIAETYHLQFQSGINLDGGTASAYLSSSLRLKELQPIGSYICASP